MGWKTVPVRSPHSGARRRQRPPPLPSGDGAGSSDDGSGAATAALPASEAVGVARRWRRYFVQPRWPLVRRLADEIVRTAAAAATATTARGDGHSVSTDGGVTVALSLVALGVGSLVAGGRDAAPLAQLGFFAALAEALRSTPALDVLLPPSSPGGVDGAASVRVRVAVRRLSFFDPCALSDADAAVCRAFGVALETVNRCGAEAVADPCSSSLADGGCALAEAAATEEGASCGAVPGASVPAAHLVVPFLVAFMPHCPGALYENIVASNWTPSRLQRLAVVGNDPHAYADTTVVAASEAGSARGGGGTRAAFPCLRAAAAARCLDVRPLSAFGAPPAAFSGGGGAGGDAAAADTVPAVNARVAAMSLSDTHLVVVRPVPPVGPSRTQGGGGASGVAPADSAAAADAVLAALVASVPRPSVVVAGEVSTAGSELARRK